MEFAGCIFRTLKYLLDLAEFCKYTLMKIYDIFFLAISASVLLTSCNQELKRENNAEITIKRNPNIIIIMCDDMGFSDIGCYGSEIPTPNIDKLAENGLRYTQFYNTARCCPTRASLLTGLYPHKTGMGWMTASDLGHPGYTGDLNNRCLTIAQVLKPAGYSTYLAGKWHVTGTKYYQNPDNVSKHNWPLQRGFDRYFGGLAGGGSYFTPKHLVSDNTFIKPGDDFFYTDAISDTAVKFINQHDVDKPFFMYVAHFAPHFPLHALPDDIEKQKGKYMIGWDSIRNFRLKKMKEIGMVDKNFNLSAREENVPDWDDIPEEEKEQWDLRMAIYSAQVIDVDDGVGKIVQALEEKGILDNTLIMFLSDNGACAEHPSWQPEYMGTDSSFTSYKINWANTSNTPLREYKKWNHEGGISTPLIIHWPEKNIQKGAFTSQMGHVIDLMPTCIEAAGAQYPENDSINELQGMSLMSSFTGNTFERGPLFFEHETNRGVRDGQWKLVSEGTNQPPWTGEWELYNIDEDRIESNNLAEKYPEIVNEMAKMWDSWAKDNNVYPLDGRGWNEKIKASK